MMLLVVGYSSSPSLLVVNGQLSSRRVSGDSAFLSAVVIQFWVGFFCPKACVGLFFIKELHLGFKLLHIQF